MSAEPFLPARRSLPALREAVQHCRGCALYENATQAVFGEGDSHADVVLVGEQPGDQEDLTGKPFVGPAGKLTRRIHQKPSWSEQMACRPWLEAEVSLLEPRVIVPLGATAGQALLGKDFRVTRDRGRRLESDLAEHVVATIHPSAVLRSEDREAEFEALVADLRVVAKLI